MAKRKKRNQKFFRSGAFVEEVIEDDFGVVGTIRIKPSTVMWKPKGAKGDKPYFAATIEEFEQWIRGKNPPRKLAQ